MGSSMLMLKDECTLCKRVIPQQFLKRCCRCGRPYCRDCTTFTKEGEIICLNCARRLVSPKKLGDKYSSLSRYLLRRGQFTDQVVLSLAKIEGIIGDNLPISAFRDEKLWTNTRSRALARSWMIVGWFVQKVDLNERRIVFCRLANPQVKKKRRNKKEATTVWKGLPYRPTMSRSLKKPSLTRIARAQARLKNIERINRSIRRYPGKFRPKTAQEKRLFKSQAKPRP